MKKENENVFDTTTKIRILNEEIKYAKSCIREHDTGHIHTAIGWLVDRVNDLKRKANLGE